MTFEDWQKTKKLVPVTDPALNGYMHAEDTEQVWLYAGGLVIEIRGGRFLLQLPMEEQVSNDLGWLEKRLYGYGVFGGQIS
jgi:hypothetical protein